MPSFSKLQRLTLRWIKSLPVRTESEPLFKSMELLTIFKLYTFKIGLFMFKCITDKAAHCIKDLFKRTHEIHSRITRQKDKLCVPFTRLETVKEIHSIQGCNYLECYQ